MAVFSIFAAAVALTLAIAFAGSLAIRLLAGLLKRLEA